MKVIIFVLLLSIGLNAYLLSPFNRITKSPTVQEEIEKYPYLSQRILQEHERDLLINFIPLRTQLKKIVQEDYKNNLTVYFEYLPTGSSIGVNDKVEFFIASLIKVPTVMAYYHQREIKNINTDPVVTIEKKHIDKDFGTLWQKGEGTKIRLSEAVKLALTESDNTAVNIIDDKITDDDYYQYIFNGLDLNLIMEKKKRQILLSSKSYSSIFKALFFSSLLSKKDSEHILELLTQSKFNDKLPAGIPSDIPIAHKIGVYETADLKIYSDCGIVYVPRRQYLLCMASRSDENTARERMKTVSKMVYDFVSSAEISK